MKRCECLDKDEGYMHLSEIGGWVKWEDVKAVLTDIMELSAGWDENGSTGPRKPLSWESVGRVAMDYARYSLKNDGDSNG